MTQFPWDTALNIVFFAVGFIIGLAQLWQAQRFFLADQRNKFDQINDAVTQIAQRLAVIEGVTNRLVEIDRTLSTIGATSTTFQERLFGIVERQFSIGEQTGQVTVAASDEIKGLIKQELPDSQFDTPDKMAQVEEKLDRVLTELSTQLLRLAQSTNASGRDLATEQLQTGDVQIIKPQLNDSDMLQVGKLRIDKVRQMAWLEESPLKLSPRTFPLLKLLMENPNRLVQLEEMIRTLYSEDTNADPTNIFVLVSRLRREIGPELIKSVRGVNGSGYILSSN